MSNRQRQKRNEESVIRQQPATPLADAVIVGAAAGGLVAGVTQTLAAEPDEAQVANGPAALPEVEPAAAALAAPDPAAQLAAPNHGLEALAAPPPAPAQMREAPTVPQQPAPDVASDTTDIEAVAHTIPLPPPSYPLVQELAGQIAATVATVADSVAAGNDTGAIADQIVRVAQDIAARLEPALADPLPTGSNFVPVPVVADLAHQVDSLTDLPKAVIDSIDLPIDIVAIAEPVLPSATLLVDTVLSQAGDPIEVADTVLDATSGISQTVLDAVLPTGTSGDITGQVLDTVADIPAAVLGKPNLAEVVDLPASVLGSEGSDIPGGLLSEIFYDDGQADLAGDLSQAAASLVSDIAPLSLSMLGQGYGDPETPGLHLNALGLL